MLLDKLKAYGWMTAAIAAGGLLAVQTVRLHTEQGAHQRLITSTAQAASRHEADLARANQKALDETIKMQRTKDEAIRAAQDRAKVQAANAAALRYERDGLRAQLSTTSVQLPGASCASVRAYAATINGLFDQCAGAFEGMAGKAQGHAADSRLMLEAWPTHNIK